jgi:hypothetical protein
MMTLTKTKGKVKIEGERSEEFDIKEGLRQGDMLSTILFNLAPDKVMREVGIANLGGTPVNRLTQYLVYADDIRVEVITQRMRELEEGGARMESNAEEMGLRINRDKTKYMLSSRKCSSGQDINIIITGATYKKCSSFKYLSSLISENNNMKEEIRTRIAAGNRCYLGLQRILKAGSLSKNLKLQVYRTVVRPVVMYGSETWTLLKEDEESLTRWEHKILRQISGAVRYGENWRTKTNEELRSLYKKPDIVNEIKSNRFRWLGHVQMPEERCPRRVFYENPGGLRQRGRLRKRWIDGVEEDLSRMGVRR